MVLGYPHEVEGVVGHLWVLWGCPWGAGVSGEPVGAGEHLWDARASSAPMGAWGSTYGMQGTLRAPMGAKEGVDGTGKLHGHP